MGIVGLKNICTPSYVYLVISMIALLVIGIEIIIYLLYNNLTKKLP